MKYYSEYEEERIISTKKNVWDVSAVLRLVLQGLAI
jgi:hypothetical protein